MMDFDWDLRRDAVVARVKNANGANVTLEVVPTTKGRWHWRASVCKEGHEITLVEAQQAAERFVKNL